MALQLLQKLHGCYILCSALLAIVTFPVTDVLEYVLILCCLSFVAFIVSQSVLSLHLASFCIVKGMQSMARKHEDSSTCLKYVMQLCLVGLLQVETYNGL